MDRNIKKELVDKTGGVFLDTHPRCVSKHAEENRLKGHFWFGRGIALTPRNSRNPQNSKGP